MDKKLMAATCVIMVILSVLLIVAAKITPNC